MGKKFRAFTLLAISGLLIDKIEYYRRCSQESFPIITNFSRVRLSDLITSSPSLQIIAPPICNRSKRANSTWKPHTFTSRSLEDMEDLLPSFISWWILLDSASTRGHLLEIGAGAGRALLDLKARHPYASAYGTNYRGYGYGQIDGSEEEMWSVCDAFKITVRCDPYGRPLFPSILGLPKVQHSMLPFPSDYFDLIFSRHSLNEGKVQPIPGGKFQRMLLNHVKVILIAEHSHL